MNTSNQKAGLWGYAGLFTLTLSSLMYETLLTRIFSVTMWYHFAFMAISVAMFGMTFGAIIVYIFPSKFEKQKTHEQMAGSSLGFAIFGAIGLLTHLAVPISVAGESGFNFSIITVYSIFLTYIALSIPFVFSGICVCLALTRFPGQVGKLYAFDLIGGATGCLLIVQTLKVMSAQGAVFTACAGGAVSSVFFSLDYDGDCGNVKRVRKMQVVSGVLAILLIAVVLWDAKYSIKGEPAPLRLQWVKGKIEDPALYERWNTFSRVRVEGNPDTPSKPFGWGLSTTYPSERLVKQLMMNIDATAATPLIHFTGNFNDVDFLKFDVTNIAHFIRKPANVLVIGAGGGRDILSALTFGQKSVTGVEINEEVLRAVRERFGDFTGHIDRRKEVRLVNDEARSYLARSNQRFGIIQLSLVDTWAATASGAYVLSENSLYTVEAWKVFLRKLVRGGILSVSRWYYIKRPAEMYRITSLAVKVLRDMGIRSPRNHIMIIRAPSKGGEGSPDGIGTLLLSPSPFTEEDVSAIEKKTLELKFGVVLTPRFAVDPVFESLTSTDEQEFVNAVSDFPLNIAPPADDRPFFFHMLRFRDIFEKEKKEQGAMTVNQNAVQILGILLFVVVSLSLLCIMLPLFIAMKKKGENINPGRQICRQISRQISSLSLYFAAIGLGYMMIEISQMQKLMVILGHPVYGLVVVLFIFLLSSGAGSYFSERMKLFQNFRWSLTALMTLVVILGATGIFMTKILQAGEGAQNWVRIGLSASILIPAGFLMGMPFPLGMKKALGITTDYAPYLWGINGAMSVCAGVISVAISLFAGISISYWTGVACYVVALLAFLLGFRLLKGSAPDCR